MGAIKPIYIKSLAKQLLKDVVKFTDDFEVNKKLVEEYTNIESKDVRNRVAGYITHRKRKESKKEDVKA
ncbi:MAG: 30S ribosomal protein S17e [Methanophagales archaeon ANME-1-THS]|nr:MAG: 30S ribosomal protein S17e [Methanophagales archaeon ANME-1-THS]